MPDYLRIAERAAKAVRAGLSYVGAAVDCSLPARVDIHRELFDQPAFCCCDQPNVLQQCGPCRLDEHAACAEAWLVAREAENEVHEPMSDWFRSTPESELLLDAERVVVAANELSAAISAHFKTSDASAGKQRGSVDDPAAAVVQPAPAAGVGLCPAVYPSEILGREVWCDLRDGHTGDHEATGENGMQSRWKVRSAPVDLPPADPGAESPAPEFDWVTWVIPAITDVLAEHVSVAISTGICCLDPNNGESYHAIFDNWHDYRDHVAPIIAARIHSAAADQK
jgi:hypothetical protein